MSRESGNVGAAEETLTMADLIPALQQLGMPVWRY